jgi:CheY-like chemotaxis protein
MARVLLVDDEQDMLFLFQLILENAGHTVETLDKGSQGCVRCSTAA